MLGRDAELDLALAKAGGKGKDASASVSSIDIPRSQGFQVRNILLVSTAYDHFLIEEEGRLSEMLRRLYHRRERDYVPAMTHVGTGRGALEHLGKAPVDLLVVFNPLSDMPLCDMAREAKRISPCVKLVYLANNTPQLERVRSRMGSCGIDMVFAWSGEGKIFLSIVQYIEDRENFGPAVLSGSKAILVAVDAPAGYSQILSEVYASLFELMDGLTGEDLTYPQRMARLHGIPKVLLAVEPKEAAHIIEKHHADLVLCIVQERFFGPGKIDVARVSRLTKRDPLLKVLEICTSGKGEKGKNWNGKGSGNGKGNGKGKNAKSRPFEKLIEISQTYVRDLRQYLEQSMCVVPLELAVEGEDRPKEVFDLRSLETAIRTVPDTVLCKALRRGTVQRWLVMRSEHGLAQAFDGLGRNAAAADLRGELLRAMDEHRRSVLTNALTDFLTPPSVQNASFVRLGGGSLGGKARGLAFMRQVLSRYLDPNAFPGVTVEMPRTLVICTDVFDDFVLANRLMDVVTGDMSDQAIVQAFQHSDLPATVLGDLRTFVAGCRSPLAVRSSSMLEDALFQPFAGVYNSVMLANGKWDTDQRFLELTKAIKSVYSSTFLRRARDYLRSTPNTPYDEKMAVIIQDAAGTRHGERFYPTISGVARSYNYYPLGPCKHEEGVVNLALGLGKTVVDGALSFQFCPARPKISFFGDTRTLLKQTQTEFLAIDMAMRYDPLSEDGSVAKYGLDTAMADGTLDLVASTYSPQSDRMYPGVGNDGPKVLDFAPILQLGRVPVAQIATRLLKLCEKALGYPVEIEFAMDLDPASGLPAKFWFLQVRSMVSRGEAMTVDINGYDKSEVVAYSERSLGNGVFDHVRDVVYVRPETFDLANTKRIVAQIRAMNERMLREKTRYLLIGPGRWGSSDPWLGIPVAFSDISASQVIVEMPVKERHIDPSEGSHFFHNRTSAGIGYLTMVNGKGQDLDWRWLASLKAVEEAEDVRWVRSPRPLEVRIDGSSGKGIILKPHDAKGVRSRAVVRDEKVNRCQDAKRAGKAI